MHGNVGCIRRKLNPIRGRNSCEKEEEKKKRRRSYLTRPETSARDTAKIVMKVTLEIGVDDQSGRFRSKSNQGEGRPCSGRKEKKKEKKEKGVCL